MALISRIESLMNTPCVCDESLHLHYSGFMCILFIFHLKSFLFLCESPLRTWKWRRLSPQLFGNTKPQSSCEQCQVSLLAQLVLNDKLRFRMNAAVSWTTGGVWAGLQIKHGGGGFLSPSSIVWEYCHVWRGKWSSGWQQFIISSCCSFYLVQLVIMM